MTFAPEAQAEETRLFATQVAAREWHITGATYDYRETIKALPLINRQWNGEFKRWEIFQGILPESIVEIIKRTGGTIKDVDGEVTDYSTKPATPLEKEALPTKPVSDIPPAAVKKASGKNVKLKRKVRLLPRFAPITNTFETPSYWNQLCTYLIPREARPVIALVGPAGNGKTTVAEEALLTMGYKDYEVLDATEFVEPADLIGAMSFASKEGEAKEVWRDGIVTGCFRKNRGLIINEFDAMNPRSGLCLQSTFQDRGANGRSRYVTLAGNKDESRVFPAGDCPIILTLNTYGTGATRRYVGRNSIDAASLDRITFISTTYENEDRIIQKRGYSRSIASKLLGWARRVRAEIDRHELTVIVSNRTLLRMAQSLERFNWSWEKTLELEFFGRLEPDFRALLAKVK